MEGGRALLGEGIKHSRVLQRMGKGREHIKYGG